MVKLQPILLTVFLLVGLSSGIGGYLGSQYVDDQLHKGINDLLVIPKPGDKGYSDFLTNEDAGDVPKFRKYYFWNLTNPDEYLGGAQPSFKQIGPYVYRQYDRKFNVQFSNDNSEITYQTFTYFEFSADESFAGASVNDKIVNINPAYQGVIAGAGSEFALVTGFVGPAVQSIMEGLQGDFTNGVIAQGDGLAMNTIVDGLKGDFTTGVTIQGRATAMNTIVEGLTGDFTNGVIAQGDGLAMNTIVDGLKGDFTSSVVAQGNALALEGIRDQAVENFEFVINATTAVKIIKGNLDNLAVGLGVTGANDAFFNNTDTQGTYATSVEGVSEAMTGGLQSLQFSNETITKFLYTGVLDAPALFDDLVQGTGALAYLELYNNATNGQGGLDDTTLQFLYNATQPQLDALAGYLKQYMIENNTEVASQYSGFNGGQTTQEGAITNLYTQWVNASIVPAGLDINSDGYDGDGFELSLTTDYGIDNATVTALFNSSSSVALTNSAQGIFTWLLAAQGNTTLQGLLAASYPGLNATEFLAIYTWLGQFHAEAGLGTQLALANIASATGYTPGTLSTSDIAFLHWANSGVTGGVTLNVLSPEAGLPAAPEYWAATGDTLSLNASRGLLSNPGLNLTSTNGAGYFLIEAQKVIGGNATALAVINAAFGNIDLNATQVGLLASYLSNPITNVFVLGNIALATGNTPGTLTTADIAYLHWANPGVTGGITLNVLSPEAGLPTAPEYWDVTGDTMSLNASRGLLSNPGLNLTSTEGVGYFLLEAQKVIGGNATALAVINAAFGNIDLNATQVGLLAGYLNNPIYDVFVLGGIAEATGEAFGTFGTADLGYLHWANPGVTGGITLNVLSPEAGLPTAPEYWAVTGDTLSLADAKGLLSNPGLNLTSTDGVGFFLIEAQKVLAGNATALAVINGAYGNINLNATQVGLLAGYLMNPIAEVFVMGNVALATGNTPGTLSTSDLAYLHWGNPGVTGGITLNVLSPDAGLPGPVEFWNVTGVNLSLENSKALLNGSKALSLQTTDGVAFMLQQAAQLASNPTAVVTAVNTAFKSDLTATEIGLVAQYIGYLQQKFILEATLQPIFDKGGGLVTTRTIDEWLFQVDDPLLVFLKANGQDISSTNAGLFTNAESENDPRIPAASTVKTGRDDINNILQYVNWRGMTKIDDWKTPETITGTDATQFAPDVSKSDTLQAFVSDLLRVVDFVYDSDIQVEGIDLYKFVISEAALAIDANYYQSIDGLANMTKSAGVPLFLSKPAFLDAASSLLTAVKGLTPDRAAYDTYLGVEPTTGAVFDARKRLQINFDVSKGNFINTGVVDTMMPVLWVEEGGTIPKDSASDFVSTVYGAQNLQSMLRNGGVVFGAIIATISLGMLVRRRI